MFDADRPRTDPGGGPATRVLVFPRADATILDTWQVAGLNGTGSHDYTVTDLFVPEERTFELTGEPAYHDGPLYKGRFFLLAHGAHGLGIARAAVDALTELVRSKPQSGAGLDVYVRDRPYVQTAVAQAEALVRGARAYLWEATRRVWEEACATGTLSVESRALARLANSAAFESAVRAVDLAYTVGGGTSVNAIPFDAWMEVDMRSIDNAALATLEKSLLNAVDQALKDENVRWNQSGALKVAKELVGDRPAGLTPAESPIVDGS